MGHHTIPVNTTVFQLGTHRYSNAGEAELQSRFRRALPERRGYFNETDVVRSDRFRLTTTSVPPAVIRCRP
jgi:hypothetical protein